MKKQKVLYSLLLTSGLSTAIGGCISLNSCSNSAEPSKDEFKADGTLIGGASGEFRFIKLSNNTISIVGVSNDFTAENLNFNNGKIFYENNEYTITSIGDSAFNNNINIKGKLILPNTITSIGRYAFSGCINLDDQVTLSENLTFLGANAFSDCINIIGTITIPKDLIEINESAFFNCESLKWVKFANDAKLTNIKAHAFQDCKSLTDNFDIPSSIKSIGMAAFKNCVLLKSINLYDGLETINDYAFANCISLFSSLLHEPLEIPNTVTHIGNYAFSSCSGMNGEITIGNSVKSIGIGAFMDCKNLTGKLTIPNSVTTIGDNAFAACSKLTSLVLNNGLETIGSYAFIDCSGIVGNLIIPNSVKSIGDGSFCNMGLTQINLKSKPIFIGSYAFSENASLNYFDITEINEVMDYQDEMLSLCDNLTAIYVPNSLLDAYKANTTWSLLASKIVGK